mgnify:CR=1 FL=1
MSVAEDLRSGETDEASLTLRGARHDLQVRRGTLGPDVSDGAVREKRGAGAGWRSPSRVTYVSRAFR